MATHMPSQAASPPPKNLPRGDLLQSRDEYITTCVPLYEASMTGNWERAKGILDARPELVRFSITENCDTALHIAASAKSSKMVETFVENLVNLMTREDLELQNENYNTALCLAAASGDVNIVKTMLGKNKDLIDIPGNKEMMPLYIATLFGQREMVNYLYEKSNNMTSDSWTDQTRTWVFEKCVEANLFDVALTIVTKWEELAKSKNVLGVLARKTEAFTGKKPNFDWRIICQTNCVKGRPAEKLSHPMPLLGCSFFIFFFAVNCVKGRPAEKLSHPMPLLRTVWKNIMKLPKTEIDEIIRGHPDKQDNTRTPSNSVETKKKHSSRILFVAAEMGNTEFIVELIRQYPDLIWKINDDNQSIFHVAVTHRHLGIYNLLHEIGSMKDMITPLEDPEANNMLHLVGKSAKTKRLQDVSGVALQMQRELLWFKEVEAKIPPTYREKKNNDGLTPHELFSKEHKDLMSASEKWMKVTASQSMVVAALIATIVFAAAFTVPGGYNQDDGFPMFIGEKTFIAFVIADAISLTFSSISILIFLSILTSRYAEDDFKEKLPKRLVRGLATLFLSIAAMMVAFSVSFFVLYHNSLIWVPIVISVFASIPVILYVRLQYDLLLDVYHSTYGSKNLFKPKKFKLYYQNPKC